MSMEFSIEKEPRACNIRGAVGIGCFAALLLLATAARGQTYDGSCSTLADVEALPAGHWCEVPNSFLRDAEKKPSDWPDFDGNSSASYQSYQRNLGIRSIIETWNGAAYDTDRDRLIIFGGGHNGYAGNELYAFSIETLSWSRLTDPTAFPSRNAVSNADGTPTSRHTYGGLAYISTVDELFALGGAGDSETGGCGVRGAWRFDFRAFEASGEYSPSQWSLRNRDGEPPVKCEDDAVFDPISGFVYYNYGYNPSGWAAYDTQNDTWTNVNGDQIINGSSSVIPGDRRFIVTIGEYFGEGPNGYVKWDGVGTSRLTKSVVSTNGAKAMEQAKNPGIAYDPSVDRVVAWAGGDIVYSLDVDAAIWEEHRPPATNLANPGPVDAFGGTYGRFAYSSTYNVYVTVDSVNESVFLYRLGPGSGTPQDPPPSAPTWASQ